MGVARARRGIVVKVNVRELRRLRAAFKGGAPRDGGKVYFTGGINCFLAQGVVVCG